MRLTLFGSSLLYCYSISLYFRSLKKTGIILLKKWSMLSKIPSTILVLEQFWKHWTQTAVFQVLPIVLCGNEYKGQRLVLLHIYRLTVSCTVVYRLMYVYVLYNDLLNGKDVFETNCVQYPPIGCDSYYGVTFSNSKTWYKWHNYLAVNNMCKESSWKL